MNLHSVLALTTAIAAANRVGEAEIERTELDCDEPPAAHAEAPWMAERLARAPEDGFEAEH